MKVKKSSIAVLAALFVAVYWFYQVESLDAYKFKRAVKEVIEGKKETVLIKDIFPENWELVCPIAGETIDSSNFGELKNYVVNNDRLNVPNTFSYNYNYGLIFLLNQSIRKVIKVKDPKIQYKDQPYYLFADKDIHCYSRSNAIIKTEKDIPPYHSYNVLVGEIK